MWSPTHTHTLCGASFVSHIINLSQVILVRDGVGFCWVGFEFTLTHTILLIFIPTTNLGMQIGWVVKYWLRPKLI